MAGYYYETGSCCTIMRWCYVDPMSNNKRDRLRSGNLQYQHLEESLCELCDFQTKNLGLT